MPLRDHFRPPIVSVEPGPDAVVDAQIDHAPEPLTIVIEQSRQRLAVAAAEPLDQVGCVVGRLVHENPHTLYAHAKRQPGQKKDSSR